MSITGDYYSDIKIFKEVLIGIQNTFIDFFENLETQVLENGYKDYPELEFVKTFELKNERLEGSYRTVLLMPDIENCVFKNLKSNKRLESGTFQLPNQFYVSAIDCKIFRALRKIMNVNDDLIVPIESFLPELDCDFFKNNRIFFDDIPNDIIFTMDCYKLKELKDFPHKTEKLSLQVQKFKLRSIIYDLNHPVTHLILPFTGLLSSVSTYEIGLIDDSSISPSEKDITKIDNFVIIPFTPSISIDDLKDYTINCSRLDNLQLLFKDKDGNKILIENEEYGYAVNLNIIRKIGDLYGFAYAN